MTNSGKSLSCFFNRRNFKLCARSFRLFSIMVIFFFYNFLNNSSLKNSIVTPDPGDYNEIAKSHILKSKIFKGKRLVLISEIL